MAGQLYFFKIRVATSAFERIDDEYGVWSDIVNVTAIDDPSAPLSFVVTGRSNGIELTWIQPTTLGGSDILHYNLHRSEASFFSYDSSGVTKIISLDNATFSYLDTTATSGITYYYMVVSETIIGIGPGTSVVSGEVDVESGDPTDDTTDDTADDGDDDGGGIPSYPFGIFMGVIILTSIVIKSKNKKRTKI